ncbi:hypothetical protein D3C78_1364740 [compost metagenome]
MPGAGRDLDDAARLGLDQPGLQVLLEIGVGDGGIGLVAAAGEQQGEGKKGKRTHGGHRFLSEYWHYSTNYSDSGRNRRMNPLASRFASRARSYKPGRK